MIRECDWSAISSSIDNRSPFSKFFLDENIQFADILSAIFYDQWFGIISVNIHTPESVKERFQRINFGTLFEKLSITEDMLGESQRSHCYNTGLKFPLDPQLQGFRKLILSFIKYYGPDDIKF